MDSILKFLGPQAFFHFQLEIRCLIYCRLFRQGFALTHIHSSLILNNKCSTIQNERKCFCVFILPWFKQRREKKNEEQIHRKNIYLLLINILQKNIGLDRCQVIPVNYRVIIIIQKVSFLQKAYRVFSLCLHPFFISTFIRISRLSYQPVKYYRLLFSHYSFYVIINPKILCFYTENRSTKPPEIQSVSKMFIFSASLQVPFTFMLQGKSDVYLRKLLFYAALSKRDFLLFNISYASILEMNRLLLVLFLNHAYSPS